jgi:glycosyltransferase involved in cell wall biosynthesis
MDAEKMSLADVSVILPTRNEAGNIRTFLSSLPSWVPLIVVDSSHDHTPDILLEARPLNTVVISQPANIPQARNIGAQMARTRWLLFTDADVVFDKNYFARLNGYLQGEAGLVYGPKHSAGGYEGYYRLFVWGQSLAHRLGIPAASGSNLLIRRDAFQACDGFDEKLTVNEDTEIAFRIKRAGFAIIFAPHLPVYATDHRRLRRGVLRKTLHSAVRGLLLYFRLMPERWRSHDWGYWS